MCIYLNDANQNPGPAAVNKTKQNKTNEQKNKTKTNKQTKNVANGKIAKYQICCIV